MSREVPRGNPAWFASRVAARLAAQTSAPVGGGNGADPVSGARSAALGAIGRALARGSSGLERFEPFAAALRADGIRRVLLLAAGAPARVARLHRDLFGVGAGCDLTVLDGSDADAVLATADATDFERTLLLVADDPGEARETGALFRYFRERARRRLGGERTARHLAVVAAPGSALTAARTGAGLYEELTEEAGAGPASALGLLIATLLGVDARALLARAARAAHASGAGSATSLADRGPWLGAALATLVEAKRDKLTLLASPRLAGFGDWLELLLVDVAGADGAGIVPIVGESPDAAARYGDDRAFLRFELSDRPVFGALSAELEGRGHPVLSLAPVDPLDVGAHALVWQLAVREARAHLGESEAPLPAARRIDPQVRVMLDRYAATGRLPNGSGGVAALLSADTLRAFLAETRPGSYVAVQAFLPPDAAVRGALARLSAGLRAHLAERAAGRTTVPVTVGFAPACLHAGAPLLRSVPSGAEAPRYVIQFLSEPRRNVPIPDATSGGADPSSFPASFYALKKAQALGARAAFRDAGCRVIHFNLGQRAPAALTRLADSLAP